MASYRELSRCDADVLDALGAHGCPCVRPRTHRSRRAQRRSSTRGTTKPISWTRPSPRSRATHRASPTSAPSSCTSRSTSRPAPPACSTPRRRTRRSSSSQGCLVSRAPTPAYATRSARLGPHHRRGHADPSSGHADRVGVRPRRRSPHRRAHGRRRAARRRAARSHGDPVRRQRAVRAARRRAAHGRGHPAQRRRRPHARRERARSRVARAPRAPRPRLPPARRHGAARVGSGARGRASRPGGPVGADQPSDRHRPWRHALGRAARTPRPRARAPARRGARGPRP